MCLGDAERVEAARIDGHEYLVFRCQRCQNNASDQKCLECGKEAGHMIKCRDKGWIHPVCALAYPQIYAISSPKTMEFAVSKEIDAANLYKVDTEKKCAICDEPSARLLQTDDDSGAVAHAFCAFQSSMQAAYEVNVEGNNDYEATHFGRKCWAAQIIQ